MEETVIEAGIDPDWERKAEDVKEAEDDDEQPGE